MGEIFAEFGEAPRSEALVIKRIVVAAAQEAVQAEDEKRLHSGIVRTPHVGDVAGKLARNRVTFAAERPNSLDVSLAGRCRQAFGKQAHHVRILSWTDVASHNVVIQKGFQFSPLLLGHLSKMLAAVHTLLFTG